ncbi:AMP phosphorylase [Candidatus Micrarchaeota archaeon]|nr:AMP phosphorylase [Candidatus Micrarchaeota archaeon]
MVGVVNKAEIWKLRQYKAKAKCFDIEAGKFIVVLNEDEAHENDLYVSDRIVISKGSVQSNALVDLSNDLVQRGEVGFFSEVSSKLKVNPGDVVEVRHTDRPASVDYIRKKIDGKYMEPAEIKCIISDLLDNTLSEVELSAWITAMHIRDLSSEEVVSLTNAIVDSGSSLNLGRHPIADKHCAGGVANNRTSMVIVPILAAAGLYIPKTSSRAITSASGTADTMEVLANVEFHVDEMREIVLKTKGCLVWGGGINLAPADDKMIRIRRSMHLDPRGLLMASILAKKKSVGAEFIAIDLPVGRGSKMEDMRGARLLAKEFLEIGAKLGMKIECFITDGSDPIGNGVGPGLECIDVLQVLQGTGPVDLMDKSCQLSGALLELAGKVEKGAGYEVALSLIKSGKAYNKMREIIEAQGGNANVRIDDIPVGKFRHEVVAEQDGRVENVNNKMISHIARAAGAPKDKGAGVILHCEHGDKVKKGDVLFEIISENDAKLSFALKALAAWPVVELQKVILGKVSQE